jgi:hypothetical protein
MRDCLTESNTTVSTGELLCCRNIPERQTHNILQADVTEPPPKPGRGAGMRSRIHAAVLREGAAEGAAEGICS